MSMKDTEYKEPDFGKRPSDVAAKVFAILKLALSRLWGMTPFGESDDVAYYSGMDGSEEGRGELVKIKAMNIGCAVYGLLYGFFLTWWFVHVSDVWVGDAPVVSIVLNTVLIILWFACASAVTAFIYFILKWTVVKGLGLDGLEIMQVAIMYAVLCQLLSSVLAFLIF